MTLDPDPNWAKILDPDPNTLTLSKYRGQFRYKCYAEIPIIIGTVLQSKLKTIEGSNYTVDSLVCTELGYQATALIIHKQTQDRLSNYVKSTFNDAENTVDIYEYIQ